MDPAVATNETPASSAKKAAPAPYVHDSGPTHWYQSKWFVWAGSITFFLAFVTALIYLSITESRPITATPTKPPTSAPVEIVSTTAPTAVNLTSAPTQAPAKPGECLVTSWQHCNGRTSVKVPCWFVKSCSSVQDCVEHPATLLSFFPKGVSQRIVYRSNN